MAIRNYNYLASYATSYLTKYVASYVTSNCGGQGTDSNAFGLERL